MSGNVNSALWTGVVCHLLRRWITRCGCCFPNMLHCVPMKTVSQGRELEALSFAIGSRRMNSSPSSYSTDSGPFALFCFLLLLASDPYKFSNAEKSASSMWELLRGLLYVGTNDRISQMIFCCGGQPVPCWMLSSSCSLPTRCQLWQP